MTNRIADHAAAMLQAGHSPNRTAAAGASLLARCEAFIAGFEDDSTQEGVVELLADLRNILYPRAPTNDDEFAALADEATQVAINAGCEYVQAAMGVETGDVAGNFWAGGETDSLRDAFDSYIHAERASLAGFTFTLSEGRHASVTLSKIDPDTGKGLVLPCYLVRGGNAYWLENAGPNEYLMTAPLNGDGSAVLWDDGGEVDPAACEEYDEICVLLND